MNFPELIIGLTPTGRIRVYVWGQHSQHLMDWRGENNRILAVPKQHSRFESIDDAVAWARDRFETKAKLEEWAKRAGNGHHFGDRHPLMKYLDWKVLLKDEATFAAALESLAGPMRYVKEIQAGLENARAHREIKMGRLRR